MRREAALEMSRTISNSKLVEIPNAAHPVHTDNPSKFQEAALDFLNDCGLVNGKRIF